MNRKRPEIKSLCAKIIAYVALAALLVMVATACGGETRGPSEGQGGAAEGGANITRPIDMIVPFGPGGGSDQMSRLVASVMEEELGVQFPVINTPGATGSTGITSMLSRPPGSAVASFIQDTLATVAFGIASFQMDDLQAVCRTQEMPSGMFVAGDGPYDSWDQLAEAARQNPGEIRIATVGRGGVDSIIIAALAEQGLEFRAVPFADPGERYTALLGGQVDALYEQPGDLLQQLESGQFKPVLMFAEEPVEGLEGDYVLSTEAGLAEVPVLPQFRGIVTNSDTDPATVQALSEACAAVQESPEWEDFQAQNFSVEDSYMDSQEFETYMNEQLAELEALIQKYGLEGQ